MVRQLSLIQGDVLLIVDVQNDFLPGGALGVADGDAVIPVLNRYIERFERHRLPIWATRDWHPADHCSFQANGGPWPSHCVQGTPGAAFAGALNLPTHVRVFSKATQTGVESYSAFGDPALAACLEDQGIIRLFIGGLATDYCVLNTVKDVLARGYQAWLLEDAVRAVDVQPGDGERALAEMRQAGANVTNLSEIEP